MNKSQTQTLFKDPLQIVKLLYERAGGVYSFFIALVLLALEVFNFSTTKFALGDLLGNVGFGTATWAAILATAFCGMDLIGIIRLFTPRPDQTHSNEDWFLLGAWLIAAVMNMGLTWWGVSIAIYNHPVESVLVVDPMTIVTVIPIFVALMVMLIRILIIGNLSATIRRVTPQAINSSSPAQRPLGFKPQAVNAYTQRSAAPQSTHSFSPHSHSE
ncbi:MAG: hypothetical protein GYA18_10600 [Chloroflexi bacterium]|nr:hypothetical protein [Chloroflexota bacterium]